jgi:glycosyltransferase involved in cell wall biosynthesis
VTGEPLPPLTDGHTGEPGFAFANPAGMSVGGVTTWSLTMARLLRAAGRRAVILDHPRANLPQLGPSAYAGLPVVRCHSLAEFGKRGKDAASYRGALPATLVPNWSAETYGVCARLSRTASREMRVLGYCHTYESFYFWFLRYYEPIIHRFVAVSEECAAELRRLMPGRERDVSVRPYAVALPGRLDRSYAPAGRPLRLLYAGRIKQAQKRVLDLPVLARRLSERGVDFALRIVGDGTERAALAARVAALDAATRARVAVEPGRPPETMAALLQETDVCILVSEYEGTSIFMLEGMAHGCVPVVTRVSGTAGVIEEGVNGHSVPVGGLGAMAEILAGFDKDRVRLAALGNAAARKARKYSYGAYLDWFLGLAAAAWSEPSRAWPAGRPYTPGLNGVLRRLEKAFPSLPNVAWALRSQAERAWRFFGREPAAAGPPVGVIR